MKELFEILSASGADAECHLLESITEEDREALFPIIKMAFPILQWERYPLSFSNGVPIGMQMYQNVECTDWKHMAPFRVEPVVNLNTCLSEYELALASHSGATALNGMSDTTGQRPVHPSPRLSKCVAQSSEKFALEESWPRNGEKLVLSLNAASTTSSLHSNAREKELTYRTSSDYYDLQKPDLPLEELHFKEDNMESNSCSSCKSSESSTLREIGVIRAITNPVNSNESFPPVNNERMLGSSWQCRDIESNRILLPKCQSLGDDRKTEKEPGQSELSETYVVSSINVDASRKDRSIQRCRRSNGKQKPCARSATTGTIFCDLHHNLKSRPCGKTDASSGKAYFVKQERAEVSNENHEIPERCRRSDGKFWQCSKQAMPGFVYCENHRNRQKKSKKQPKSADSRATKDTLAAECHATTVKVEKDMDDSSFCSPSRNSGLMHLCNLIAKERELDMTVFSDSCEINIQANGRGTFNAHSECEGRNSRNAFQIGTTEVVDRFTHANREVSPKTVEYGLSSRTRSDSEVKVSVDDFGQCTLADVRKEGSTALKVNRLDSLFPASGFTPSGLGSSENDNVGFAQILQKKGMPLGCSQVSRSGSPHYEYRQLKLYYGNERHGTGQKLIVPRETDTHHEGTGDRGTDCTGEGCVGVESLDEESHGLDGLSNSIPLEILSLRQCRRKDVKGCECSNNVKDGQSNCLHHLESLSKRKTHYQCENEGRSSGICMLEEDSAIIPVTENQGPGDSKSMQKRSFDGMHSGIPNIVNVDCEYGNGPFNEPMEAASQHTSFANFMEYSRCGHLAGVFRAATDIKEFAAGHETCRKQELCASGSYQPNETSPKVISQHGKDIISGESSKQQRSMIATDCLGKSDNNTCVAQNPPLATISIGPSLQCQRKDGKGWRCSKNAEDGLKYCLHHLASLKSKRLNSKKRRKDCQQSEGQDSKVILRDTGQACPCPSSVM